MRSRFAAPPGPVVTGAAMSVGAAVAGLAWYARRRALRVVVAVPAPRAPVAAPAAVPAGRRRRRGA
jgi:hypothetical protein